MTVWSSPCSWPTLESGLRNPSSSIRLASCLMMQMLTHGCQTVNDETRGATVVTLMEMIWAQARHLSLESRTDWHDPGSQTGKWKVHHHIHGSSVRMLLLPGMPMVWSIEMGGGARLTTGRRDIKILALLEAIWFPLQIVVLHCGAADLAAWQRALRLLIP